MKQAYADCENARLWTELNGSGVPLVLCHGGPGLWDYLAPLAQLLDCSASVLRYDQRGCGRSTGTGPHNIARSIADLEALRTHFGWERWYVGGHSFGALLALTYALTLPSRCLGLLYISGLGVDSRWHDDYAKERAARLGDDGLAELVRLRECWEQTDTLEDEHALCRHQWRIDFANDAQARVEIERMLAQGQRINREVHRELWTDAQAVCFGADAAQRASKLEIPARFVHGGLDPRPAWPVSNLSELVLHGQLLLLAQAAHYSWLDQPEHLREGVVRWMVETVVTNPGRMSASKQ